MTSNEGLPGRWWPEYEHANDETGELHRWSSWKNARSFWLTRPAIVKTLKDVGFNTVFEQVDWLEEDYAKAMTTGFYATEQRAMFVGIRL